MSRSVPWIWVEMPRESFSGSPPVSAERVRLAEATREGAVIVALRHDFEPEGLDGGVALLDENLTVDQRDRPRTRGEGVDRLSPRVAKQLLYV